MYFLHYIVRRYQNTAYNYNNLKQDSIHVLYFERLTLRLKDRRNYVTMIFPLCPVNKQKILRKEYFIRTNTLKNLTVILSLFMSCVCQEQRKIEQNKRITPSQLDGNLSNAEKDPKPMKFFKANDLRTLRQ